MVNLVAYGNQFTGTIPRSFKHLPKLRHLDLSYNLIAGHIPSHTLGELVSVEALYLDHNQLEGKIPSDISQMFELQTLRLENNLFQNG